MRLLSRLFAKPERLTHDILGEVEVSSKEWRFEENHADLGSIQWVLYRSDQSAELSDTLVQRVQDLKARLVPMFESALDVIRGSDYGEMERDSGSLYPSAVMIDADRVDLEFSFRDWEDGWVLAHYRGDEFYGLSAGD